MTGDQPDPQAPILTRSTRKATDSEFVLLVEDNDVDAEQMERWLTDPIDSEPPQLHRVRDMGEALNVLDDHQPIVVLADLSLPDANRLDVVEALVKRAPDCPLVVQTGRDDPDTPLRALELGAQDYLVKGSITREDLYRSVRYAVTRHRLLRDLLVAERRIERAEEHLDDVAHVFAHDLRGPVRTARLLADRLLANLPQANDLVTEFGQLLDDALARVDRLIVSMLDYEELRAAADTQSVELRPLIELVVRDLEADLLAAGAEVEIDVHASWVQAQEEPLTRVVQNLVANSVKYRRPDVPLHITIRATSLGDRIAVSVADNGIGIAPEDRGRAFRVLERLHQVETGGLGFGLAICRRIVESFGGCIVIEEHTGPGTAVTFELERADPASAPTDR